MNHMVVQGLLGPTYSDPTDQPLTKGRWYIDLEDRRHPWKVPLTPLLYTKGQCGIPENFPIVHVPENATTVEVGSQSSIGLPYRSAHSNLGSVIDRWLSIT